MSLAIKKKLSRAHLESRKSIVTSRKSVGSALMSQSARSSSREKDNVNGVAKYGSENGSINGDDMQADPDRPRRPSRFLDYHPDGTVSRRQSKAQNKTLVLDENLNNINNTVAIARTTRGLSLDFSKARPSVAIEAMDNELSRLLDRMSSIQEVNEDCSRIIAAPAAIIGSKDIDLHGARPSMALPMLDNDLNSLITRMGHVIELNQDLSGIMDPEKSSKISHDVSFLDDDMAIEKYDENGDVLDLPSQIQLWAAGQNMGELSTLNFDEMKPNKLGFTYPTDTVDCADPEVVDELMKVNGRIITDELYMDKMENLCCGRGGGYLGVPPDPSCIGNGVFLGTTANAQNIDLVKRGKYTHILNVAGAPKEGRAEREEIYKQGRIQYEEMAIHDKENFEIWPFFMTAHRYVDLVRSQGGRLLICDPGVSRGGAIAISLMMNEGSKLLEATNQLKALRRVILANSGFMAQLVAYARTYGHLDPQPEYIKTPKYGTEIRVLDQHRYNVAPLPIFW